MIIEMKHVKCGDCFILSDNQKYLIVDCGSSNKKNPLNRMDFTYKQIEPLLLSPNKKLDLLITHFDADHYIGILGVSDQVFDKIYFPYCFFDNNLFCSTLAHILLLARGYSVEYEKISKELISLLLKLPKILKQNGRLVSLQSGDRLMFNGNAFDVIWPHHVEARKITRGINLSIVDDLDTTLPNIYEQYNLNIFNETILGFTNSLEVVFNTVNEAEFIEQSQIERLIAPLQERYDELINRRTELDYIRYLGTDTPETIVHYLRLARRYLISEMNGCSIIFHNNDLIFFGDTPIKVVDHLAKNSLFNHSYHVVKIPHHGTNGYFTKNLPSAAFYLIPNGGRKDMKVSRRFLNGKANKVYCSNCRDNRSAYCDFYNNNKQNCSISCWEPAPITI